MQDYNTQREKLKMPEYGRSVQVMVEYAIGIEDRATRQAAAETIIRLMANMFPQQKEADGFEHKLWDHLAFISGYRLDVDYPYEIIRRDTQDKPDEVPYPQSRIALRHYGKVLEAYLAKLSAMEAGPERDELASLIANRMRLSGLQFNPNSTDEQKVLSDIERYTDGKVSLDMSVFNMQRTIQRKDTQRQGAKKPGNAKKNRKKN